MNERKAGEEGDLVGCFSDVGIGCGDWIELGDGFADWYG
jgi:hypothetical protein